MIKREERLKKLSTKKNSDLSPDSSLDSFTDAPPDSFSDSYSDSYSYDWATILIYSLQIVFLCRLASDRCLQVQNCRHFQVVTVAKCRTVASFRRSIPPSVEI